MTWSDSRKGFNEQSDLRTSLSICLLELATPFHPRPYSPTPGNRSSKLDEIVSVARNQQVQYILAGASNSRHSVIWNLCGKCEVVALAYGGGVGTLGSTIGSRMAVGGRRGMSAIAWHPDNVRTSHLVRCFR